MRRIEYGGQEYLIHTRSGMRLLESMREFGIPVQCDCRGSEAGENCVVKFEKATLFLLNRPTEKEQRVLGDKLEQGYRLVCESIFK